MNIFFKLTFTRKVVTSMLEYNCFDYSFQGLLKNIIVWILNIIVNMNSCSTLNKPCPNAPVRHTPVASPINKFAEIATPPPEAPNCASMVNK